MQKNNNNSNKMWLLKCLRFLLLSVEFIVVKHVNIIFQNLVHAFTMLIDFLPLLPANWIFCYGFDAVLVVKNLSYYKKIQWGEVSENLCYMSFLIWRQVDFQSITEQYH